MHLAHQEARSPRFWGEEYRIQRFSPSPGRPGKAFLIWKFCVLIVCVASLALAACSDPWPPERVDGPPADFSPSSGYQINGWLPVYADATKADQSGMAYAARDLQIELSMNLFAIDKPADGYVESQFEVVYFDDDRTLIAVSSDKDDVWALVKTGGGLGMNATHGATFPGAKVRYRDKLYELRADGWYLNDKRLRAF